MVFSGYRLFSNPRLSPLDSFFFSVIQRLCIILADAIVSSHQQLMMILFPPGSLPNLCFVDLWWWPLWVVKFDFPLSFWLTFLQHLGNISIMSCGGDLHLFCVFFIALKGMITIYLWQLVSWKSAVLQIFLQLSVPGHFFRAAVIPHSRLCHTPVQESDRSLLSLQEWDTIPSQDGWGL